MYSREQQFWAWFLDFAEELVCERRIDTRKLRDLQEKLHTFDRALVCELEIGGNEERALTISADGIQENFYKVDSLVKAAPAVPGWKIVALRQPKVPTTVRLGEINLEPMDFRFLIVPREVKLDLTVVVQGFDSAQLKEYAAATFLFLDSVLGEYVVATRIGRIGWAPFLPGMMMGRLHTYYTLRDMLASGSAFKSVR